MLAAPTQAQAQVVELVGVKYTAAASVANTPLTLNGAGIPGTLKLAEIFTAKKRLVAGDSFTVDFVPGTDTLITINDKSATETIAEPVFFDALMKIWLGTSPADWQLKDALLGQAKAN